MSLLVLFMRIGLGCGEFSFCLYNSMLIFVCLNVIYNGDLSRSNAPITFLNAPMLFYALIVPRKTHAYFLVVKVFTMRFFQNTCKNFQCSLT